MSLKLCAPSINSRSTRGVRRVAKTSDAFAIGQNSPYPVFMTTNSNMLRAPGPVQILNLFAIGRSANDRFTFGAIPRESGHFVEEYMSQCSRGRLSRREAFAAISGAAISAVAISDASNAQSREGNKMTYVLIHPAWFGGWCWKKVTPLLRAQGHEVFTPTLTGLGERAHLARPEIGLQIHVRDITNLIEYEDLRNVIL